MICCASSPRPSSIEFNHTSSTCATPESSCTAPSSNSFASRRLSSCSAGLTSIEEGRGEEAQQIIRRALERHRATIGELRNLSFNLEPVVLRDQGFAPAVRALTDQIELAHNV